MKNLVFIFIFLMGFTIFVYSQNPSDSKASKETADLLNKMRQTIKKGILFGHQDDFAYGHSWKSTGVSDIKQVTGDFPAIFGWELGDLELGHDYSLDSVSFEEIKNGIIAVDAMHGINTISWHCNNPLTGGNAWDVSSKLVVKSVLPDGEMNGEFIRMLNHLADFFLSLKDKNGVAIPVVFRPYHEHTGSWFWWGQKLCSTEEYIALWKYTENFLKERGVHNLLYTYSAASGFKNVAEYTERYPGDEMVDFLGFDEYQGKVAGNDRYIKSVKSGLDIIVPLAKEHNKIAILSETGYESIPDKKWWTETLWPAISEYPISYVLFWRNAYNKPQHYYVPFPGQESADDFVKLVKMDKTLFLKDIQKIK